MTPEHRDQITAKVSADLLKTLPIESIHHWRGWPGTYLVARTAVAVLEAQLNAPTPHASEGISPENAALVEAAIAKTLAAKPDAAGFAMESLMQMGFRRAPEVSQPNEDPDMLEEVYTVTGQDVFGLMCLFGYGQKKPESYKLNSTQDVAVSTEVRLSKDMTACPRGVKVQLMGQGGCLVYGNYDGDAFWVQWAPLPGKAL